MIAEGCWMFSATCCCCCGRGTCIQMSHCHCCFPCIPTLVSDITPNSPCVQLESILVRKRCLFLKSLVFKSTSVVQTIKPFQHLENNALRSFLRSNICLPARGGIIMWWNDDNAHSHSCPQEVNHLFVGQCCYCNFTDFNQSASLS